MVHRRRVGIALGLEWIVLLDELDSLPLVFREHRLERIEGAAAGGALKIAELDDQHLGAGRGRDRQLGLRLNRPPRFDLLALFRRQRLEVGECLFLRRGRGGFGRKRGDQRDAASADHQQQHERDRRRHQRADVAAGAPGQRGHRHRGRATRDDEERDDGAIGDRAENAEQPEDDVRRVGEVERERQADRRPDEDVAGGVVTGRRAGRTGDPGEHRRHREEDHPADAPPARP